MKIQTAVEYLVEMICTDVQMYDEEGNESSVEYYNAFRSCTDLSEYIIKAKQMEKQQIIDAWNSAYGGDSNYTGDKYYNETFKSNKQSYQDKMRNLITKAKNTNK